MSERAAMRTSERPATRRAVVFGPAYLDRVLRVDRPLLPPGVGDGPLDRSVDAESIEPGEGLTLVDRSENRIVVEPPSGWTGPTGVIRLGMCLAGPDREPWSRGVVGSSCEDDLGGMGAGYAAAFGGLLVTAVGSPDDEVSRSVLGLLRRRGIEHRPVRVHAHPADWTLILSSGVYGDKLAIGFRGCHEAWARLGSGEAGACDLRVVAALPNELAWDLLRAPGAAVRFFAPSRRNMSGPGAWMPVSFLAGSIDAMSCNRGEWLALDADARASIERDVPIVVVTDGRHGARVRMHTARGPDTLDVPAWRADRPPLDTNRAGEAFASTFVGGMLDRGWAGGPTRRDLVRAAARRAAVAAGLVVQRLDFGFPTREEIDGAIGDDPGDDS